MYFSNCLVLPKGTGYAALWDRFTFESEEVPPGEGVILSVHLPAKFLILCPCLAVICNERLDHFGPTVYIAATPSDKRRRPDGTQGVAQRDCGRDDRLRDSVDRAIAAVSRASGMLTAPRRGRRRFV
jgi:hypothetical protein